MKNVHPRLKKGVIPHIFKSETGKVAQRHRKEAVDKIAEHDIQHSVHSTSKDYPVIVKNMEFQGSDCVSFQISN